jgi:hypothetical protein
MLENANKARAAQIRNLLKDLREDRCGVLGQAAFAFIKLARLRFDAVR